MIGSPAINRSSEQSDSLEVQPRRSGPLEARDLHNVCDLLDVQELESRIVMQCPGEPWWYPPCGPTGPSDRTIKENIAPVDSQAMLESLAAMPVFSWNYIADPATRHVGPMAQDFHGTFELGRDDRTISHMDANGIALCAIQGLYQLLQEGNALLTETRRRVRELENQIGVPR